MLRTILVQGIGVLGFKVSGLRELLDFRVSIF